MSLFSFVITLAALGIGFGSVVLMWIRCGIDKAGGWQGVTIFFNNYGEGLLEYNIVLPLFMIIIAIAIIMTFIEDR